MAACFVLAVVGAYLLGFFLAEDAERRDEPPIADISGEALLIAEVGAFAAVVIGLGGFVVLQIAGIVG